MKEREIIKEYVKEIINTLVENNNTDYQSLKSHRFEVGQICTCIDLINQIDYNENANKNTIVFHTNPTLALYRNGKQIATEEI